MTPYTVFDPATGQIKRAGWCQDHMVAHQRLDGYELERISSDPVRQYFDLQTRQPRDLRPMQINQYGNKFVDLPKPCTLEIRGVRFEIDDGTADVNFEFPGEYTLKFTAPTYQPFEVVVTV